MNKVWRAAILALILELVLGLFWGLFFPAVSSAATGRGECNTLPSKILGRPVAYCALLPPTYDTDKERRYPILYFLHGLGDSEAMFIHSGGMNLVNDLWDDHQLGEFLIVTPQGGASFYINSQDGKRRYEDFFLQEFMPAIEKRYRTEATRAHRGIAGVSMGGYGALHIAFRHPQLFVAVAVHSAALLEKLPNLSAQNAAQMTRLRVLGSAFGTPFDVAFWTKNDPLTIARTANLAGLKIYFDCGSEDDYGFDSGAAELDKLLTARHIAHEFHLYPGGHDWEYFAQHLPASLQFVSRALTSTSAAPRSSH
jgi:S-formylglutathione hydrolase FrmB